MITFVAQSHLAFVESRLAWVESHLARKQVASNDKIVFFLLHGQNFYKFGQKAALNQ